MGAIAYVISLQRSVHDLNASAQKQENEKISFFADESYMNIPLNAGTREAV